jgi:hypothetical protein
MDVATVTRTVVMDVATVIRTVVVLTGVHSTPSVDKSRNKGGPRWQAGYQSR